MLLHYEQFHRGERRMMSQGQYLDTYCTTKRAGKCQKTVGPRGIPRASMHETAMIKYALYHVLFVPTVC